MNCQAESTFGIDYFFENTAIAQSLSSGASQGFNRLRLDTLTTLADFEQFEFIFIGDGKLFYDSDLDRIDDEISIYRMYGSFEGGQLRLTAGKQRIPFGVGKIWNPVDIFNPIDSTSIEPEEREGTESFRGEYSLTELSILDATIAERKGAIRLKGFLDYGDAAIIAQLDDTNKQIITGWELEGDPTGTGIELRSEGGFFYNQDSSETKLQAIVGAEYGFPNSLTLVAELLYDGNSDQQSIGITASYQLTMLTYISLLGIVNMTDESFFLAPALQYSMSDEMTLDIGLFINHGAENTNFGDEPDTFYVKWFAHF